MNNSSTNHSFRLSRLTHPRATLVAIILLAVVFGLFGAVANALHPELSAVAPAAPDTWAGVVQLIDGWIIQS